MAVADSMWVLLTNWFTPTVLFCILNLMIGTIFIISSFKPHRKHENHENGSEAMSSSASAQFFRAPSLLERVKLLNFSFHRPDQPYPFPQVDSHEDQEQEVAEEAPEMQSEIQSNIMRSHSETLAEVSKTSTVKRMIKKSASEKIVILDKEKEKKDEEAEVVDRRRPATVRETKESKTTTQEDDEAVDEKADDFINRFRQQLKLQRIESILRYKEMLNRGAGR